MSLPPLFRRFLAPHANNSRHQHLLVSRICSWLQLPPHSVHAAAPSEIEPTYDHADLPISFKRHRSTSTAANRPHGLHRHPFARLGVADALVGRLLDKEVHYPTDIQAAAIPLISHGESCAVQSFTGSGKTLAYLLPILSKLSFGSDGNHAQAFSALVVAPSHELCMQIVREAHNLLPQHQDQIQQAICGANVARQIKSLSKHKPALVVGTPPRIAALIDKGHLLAYKRQMLVMDEVDQLLFARYQDHMRIITASVGRSLVQGRQTVLVSATLSPKVLQRASQWVQAQELAYLRTGEDVRVTRVKVADLRAGDPAAAKELSSTAAAAAAAASPTPDTPGSSSSKAADEQAARQPAAGDAKQDTSASPSLATQLMPAGVADTESAAAAFALAPQLRHFYVVTNHNRRVDAVLKCIRALGLKQVLVFVNDNQRRDFAKSRMDSSDVPVGVLHGDLSGVEVNGILARFRAGKLRALVVSDVAARGLDFPECDGVVHLELSWRPAQYSHRAGRAGRMGRPGVVLSVITEPQEAEVVQLGRRLGVTMHQAKVANRQFLVKPPKPAAAEEDVE